MATKLQDLTTFLDPGLVMPIRGREYVAPVLSAETALWCQQLAELAMVAQGDPDSDEIEALAQQIGEQAPLGPDGQRLSFERVMLGAVYDQMVTDGVQWPYIQTCARTQMVYTLEGPEAALAFWQAGGSRPEAASPANRAHKRAAKKMARKATGGRGTAAATKTPTPASTSGTSSRKTPAAKPAKTRRGGPSSATGHS